MKDYADIVEQEMSDINIKLGGFWALSFAILLWSMIILIWSVIL